MLSCQIKQVKNMVAVWHFFDKKKKAQLPEIRITEQPMLLTKRKIIVCVINVLSVFAKNRQSSLVVALVLVLESKGPYLLI